MLLGVVADAQLAACPASHGSGAAVGWWEVEGGSLGSASFFASHPLSRRRAGKSEVQPGLEANKARRRHGGAQVPLFLCCGSWLADWLAD